MMRGLIDAAATLAPDAADQGRVAVVTEFGAARPWPGMRWIVQVWDFLIYC